MDANQLKNWVFGKHHNLMPNTYDVIAFILIMSGLALMVVGVEGMHQPLDNLKAAPLDLTLNLLPKYALYTTLRMFAAIIISLIFTFIVATLAAKNKRAEMIIVPALDIFQSVPVLGFLAFTVTFFMGLFPGNQLGVELAAIFAVFTAQVWNMTFSFYQSLRTVPADLRHVSEQFCQNSWQRFWRLEVPFAIPGLIWNTMMSMSGSWFYIVAAESISVGHTEITLPGIGSWLGTAIMQESIRNVAWAVLAMGIVILLYDQFLFRPIVAWSAKFNMGQTASSKKPKSWVFEVLNRANILNVVAAPFYLLGNKLLAIHFSTQKTIVRKTTHTNKNKIVDAAWLLFLCITLLCASLFLGSYLAQGGIKLITITHVINLGFITLLRVAILVILASLIWVPIGVYVGLRPRLVAIVQPIAQFLAAFPANILFPFVVITIVHFNLNPDIWLSPLIILGTQWYIFFNIIAGVVSFPNELKEAAVIYNVCSWVWWRRVILPGIFPYYVTGALTATGGSWNASIVAEVVTWGNTKLQAQGLGAYIADASTAGDMHQVLLGVSIMSLFVIVLNQLFWRPMYQYAARLTGHN